MAKIANVESLQAETVYVVLPGYSAPGDNDRFSDAGPILNFIADALARWRSPATRAHVRTYRDYYGNPRSPAYMIDTSGSLARRSNVARAVALVGPNVTLGSANMSWIDETRILDMPLARASAADLGIAPRAQDVVLLLHSDALGIGLSKLERELLNKFGTRVVVLNGRNRCYRLDGKVCRILGRHRFLSETRIIETGLAYFASALGLVFVWIDRVLLKAKAHE